MRATTRRSRASAQNASLAATVTALLSTASLVHAQFQVVSTGGEAVAKTGSHFNQPTSSWKPWQPKASYSPSNLPDEYMGASRGGPGSDSQSGFNRCAKNAWNQQSQCQTMYINSLDDFCLWGPPTPGPVGIMERVSVAYCTTDKHGTRLIPDGTLLGAHFVRTPDYVQVTGVGDFTSIGIPLGDEGGEMDSAGADDLENPIGGVIYVTNSTSKTAKPIMASHWTNFMSWNKFCIRACFGKDSAEHCQHIYDVMGCDWNMPASYTPNLFESCDGDNAPFQGIYQLPNGKNSTFTQGAATTPLAHPVPASSNCKQQTSIKNGLLKATPIPGATGAAAAATLSGTAAQEALSSASAVVSGGGSNALQTGSGAAAGSAGKTSGAAAAGVARKGDLVLKAFVTVLGSSLLAFGLVVA